MGTGQAQAIVGVLGSSTRKVGVVGEGVAEGNVGNCNGRHNVAGKTR